jgi:hypothetical protein
MPYQSIYNGRSPAKIPNSNKDNPFADHFHPGQYLVKNQPAAPKPQPKPQAQQPAPQVATSLFNKFTRTAKDFAKSAVDDAKTTGAKTANTLAAAGKGVVGATTAAVQQATGNKRGADATVRATAQTVNESLDKGIGGKGGFLSSKQASARGGGVKSLKEDFVKPALQATAATLPYAPGMPAFKGATLFAKLAKSAATQGAASAAATTASQAATGKFNAKDIAKSALTGGVVGAVAPVAEKAIAKGAQVAKGKKLPENHPDYFNVAEKTATVPLDSIRLSKAEKENKQSSVEADRRMLAAAKGEIPKRDPVLVHASEDGKHTVLDGNATTTAAIRNGWQSVPAELVKSKNIPTADQVTAVKQVIARAHQENPDFQKAMQTAADTAGLPYHGAAPKGLGRTLAKVVDDYSGDHTAIKDTIRGTMELHDPNKLDHVISQIPEGYKVTKVKSTLDKPNGYRDVKLIVETPGGHKGEVILATPEMLKAKHELGGHELYKQARTTVDESKLAELEAKMNQLYGEADTAAKARLASAGESSVPSTKALAGGKGVPEATTTPETLPATESSRTSVSPMSKKRGNGGDSGVPIPSTIADKPSTVKTQMLTPTQTAHMPEIGGYTHSSHMATEYADMLRGMEQQVKGGQMVPDGEGGYKRISEHSRFYRDYYAEHKKLPTKAAYLEEAQRQLASGKAVHGGSGNYQALLEREAKPIPTAKVNTQPMAYSGHTKTSKLAKGVEQTAIREKLTKSLGDLPQYSKVDMKEQARLTTELMQNDEARAIRIATGQEVPPAHILPESVFTAVELKAQATGDIDLLRQLAHSSLTTEATAMGQRIAALAQRNTGSAVTSIREITQARTKAIEAKLKTTAAKATSNEIKAIRAAKPKVTRETFASFVDSLKC